MRTFADNAGRTWTIAVNVAALKAVRGRLQLDIFKLLDEGAKGLAQLLGDPIQLVDVLFVLCAEEAEKRSVSDEDFGRGMGGDALNLAAEALMGELVDFFPNPRARAGLQKMLAAGKTLGEKLLDHAEGELAKLDLDANARRWIDSFTSSAASSDSTPAPSLSASS